MGVCWNVPSPLPRYTHVPELAATPTPSHTQTMSTLPSPFTSATKVDSCAEPPPNGAEVGNDGPPVNEPMSRMAAVSNVPSPLPSHTYVPLLALPADSQMFRMSSRPS